MCVCALVCFERKQYNLFVKKKKNNLESNWIQRYSNVLVELFYILSYEGTQGIHWLKSKMQQLIYYTLVLVLSNFRIDNDTYYSH